MIYVLKPELSNGQKLQNTTSRSCEKQPVEVVNYNPNDTYVSHTDLNNVNENEVFNKGKRRKRSLEKELLASYVAEQLEDDHSLGFYRRVVDNVSESLIYQALSEVKDIHLTGKIIKSKAALFNTIIQNKAKENNINLGINKTVN